MPTSASERRLQATMAAHQSWAATDDRAGRTQAARAKFLGRFEAEVDPAGRLDPVERNRRAEHARRAYMSGLALKSAKARRLRSEADDLDRVVAEAKPS